MDGSKSPKCPKEHHRPPLGALSIKQKVGEKANVGTSAHACAQAHARMLSFDTRAETGKNQSTFDWHPSQSTGALPGPAVVFNCHLVTKEETALRVDFFSFQLFFFFIRQSLTLNSEILNVKGTRKRGSSHIRKPLYASDVLV